MKISINNFKNVNGIKDLKDKNNTTNEEKHDAKIVIEGDALIYAPNGGTKTSLAKGLESIANGEIPKDRIFDKSGEYNIEIDDRRYTEMTPQKIDNILVYNYESYYQKLLMNNELSTLAMSSELYDKFHPTIEKYEEVINNCFNAICNDLSKKKSDSDKAKEVNDFFSTVFNIVKKKDIIVFLNTLKWDDKIEISDEINIFDVINAKTKVILEQENIKTNIEKLNELLSKQDTIFFGKFSPASLESLMKEIEVSGYFEAGHSLKFRNYEELVPTESRLKDIYKEEKEKFFNSEEGKNTLESLLTSLKKNKETKQLESIIRKQPELFEGLENIEAFKANILAAKLFPLKDTISNTCKIIDKLNVKIKEFLEASKREESQWQKICDEFENRFDVPYRIAVEDEENALLGEKALQFIITYYDGNKDVLTTNSAKLSDEKAKEVLSTGELRALTVLRFLFDLEDKVNNNDNVFVVLDDVVDSFDYKNKYAMLEYLDDISYSDKKNITCWILTHNFDFFSNCSTRIGYKSKYFIQKSKDCEILHKLSSNDSKVSTGGLDFFKDFKGKLDSCNTNTFEKAFYSLLPVCRNIIELSSNGNVNENEDYKLLCSALHYKDNTESLEFNEFQSIYKDILGIESKNLINNNKKIYEVLLSIANSIQKTYRDNNSKYNELSLPEKIVLSIAIRIELEKYLNDYYGIVSSSDNTDDNKNTLASKFTKVKNYMRPKECKIFTKAIVSTPDFIHLNSFMYEPIVDVGFGTLVSLYSDVQSIMENKNNRKEVTNV